MFGIVRVRMGISGPAVRVCIKCFTANALSNTNPGRPASWPTFIPLRKQPDTTHYPGNLFRFLLVRFFFVSWLISSVISAKIGLLRPSGCVHNSTSCKIITFSPKAFFF